MKVAVGWLVKLSSQIEVDVIAGVRICNRKDSLNGCQQPTGQSLGSSPCSIRNYAGQDKLWVNIGDLSSARLRTRARMHGETTKI